MSKKNIVLTTTIYLKQNNQTLLLYRNKKDHDVNHGKWIGVGGKLKQGESPEECIIRETLEETGYTIHSMICHGYVTFPGIMHGEDEGMFVYSSNDFSGHMIECSEGELSWINDKDISKLPMWEGDYHLLEWLQDDTFHRAKIVYDNDTCIEYKEY